MGIKVFYKWSFYRRLFKYLSPLISLFESGRIRKYGNRDIEYSPVFIVGLPRSGSTILYQVLTDMFDVLYFDNLVNLGRGNLYFSMWLSRKIFKSRQHHSYSSNYGNTIESGLHAPAEAGELWYRWFPKGVLSKEDQNLPESVKNDLSRNIKALINRYNKPVLIKNLNSILRIRMIINIFPNAKFIYLKREPVYIAQSIYIAREKNKVDPNSDWWSIKFPGYESLLGMPVEEQIAHQVYNLDNLIKNELKTLASANVMITQYEDLKIEELAEDFEDFIGANKKVGFFNEALKQENIQKVDDKIFARLKTELNKLLPNG